MKKARCPADRYRREFRLTMFRYAVWIFLFYLVLFLGAIFRPH